MKKHDSFTDNSSIKIYVNKIQNRIMFKINTKIKITKDENSENVPHLEITEVLLIHYNIVNNDFQQDS